MLRTQKVKLCPNRTMQKVLDDLCDYRRYCWNQGLALWNDMYNASVILADKKQRPNERKVRDELVANKADWQFQLSARCLQLAISDLGKAKPKAEFPTEQSLNTFIGIQAMSYNDRYFNRIHKGFGQVQDTLESYFD